VQSKRAVSKILNLRVLREAVIDLQPAHFFTREHLCFTAMNTGREQHGHT
jgi:hypothetical protein